MSKRRSGLDTTKRTDTEQAQRRMDELFRALIENASDIITILDAEGIIRYASPSVERVLGYKPQELIGTHIAELLHPDDLSKSLESYAAMKAGVRSGTPEICQITEERLRHKDGSWRILEGIAKVLDTPPGAAIVINSRDITARKRVDQDLHESEERYRSLVEAAPDVIYTVSAEDGSLTSLNPAFETLTGWSRAEWLGKPFVGIVHPDDLPVAVETFQKASRGETQPPYELRVLSKSGEYLVGEFTSTPHVKDGKVVGELGIVRDITEHKRVEEALRDTEKRFRLLFERAPLSYQSLNENGCFIDVNPAWLALFGYTREEVIGRWFGEFMTPESAEAVKKNFPRFKAAGEICGLEYEMVRKDGSHFIASVSGKIGYDEQGRFAQTHCILADITERKRAEEALRESEEKHRRLFETMAQGVVYQNAEGHIISANPAAERLLGLTLAQMLGRTSMDPRWKAIHEDGSDFPGDTHPCMIALKTGKEVSHVVMGVFQPGANEYVWINIHAVPQFRPGETKPYQVYTTFDDITGRKRAEEALRQSKENFETLAESASEGILIATGEEGRHVYANRRAVEITGYPIEELLKTCMRDLAHPDELPKLAERYKERLERLEVPNRYETAFLNKDGIKVPIEISPSRTIWQNQLSDIVMFRDITERKRVEEALRRASAYNRSLIEASLDPLVTIAPDGKITDVNNTAEKVTGLSRQQLIGTDFSDYFTDSGKARAGYEQVFREGLVQDYELEIRHRNGHVTPVLYNASVYRDEAGDVIGVFAAARDITERKRAEEALRESEERFRSLVENATLGIYRTMPEGRILMVNPALVRMLGFDSFEELAARNLECEGFEPSYPRSVFRERMEREGQVVGLEAAWIRRDGSVILVRESARAVRADDGRVLHYDGIVEDITTQRHAEGAMRQLSGRLLRLQDEERRRIARQLHETTAQGLAGLAINLNMVKDSAAHLSPRASACLSESLELAEQCSREVRTLSYLLHPPLVDEAGLAPALRWYTAGFAQRSGIEVHVDVSPEFGRLPSELELTLYRIVQEALTNIHRHSGSKTARICLERRPNEIVLTVADEGHGFPSAALGIAGPESADIGVGIPGMRERVRQLEGRLHIQTGSRGTTLTAYLPLSEVAHGETTHPTGG